MCTASAARLASRHAGARLLSRNRGQFSAFGGAISRVLFESIEKHVARPAHEKSTSGTVAHVRVHLCQFRRRLLYRFEQMAQRISLFRFRQRGGSAYDSVR